MSSTDQLPRLAPADRPRFTSRADRIPARDPESQAWIDDLSAVASQREPAVEALHALLLKAARFQVNRHRDAISHLRGNDHDDLARQSADDALSAILNNLGEFPGESRFTTWAYKFAVVEAGTRIRRHARQGREIPFDGCGPVAPAPIRPWRSTPRRKGKDSGPADAKHLAQDNRAAPTPTNT